jgi:hypothetical protein
MKIAWKRVVLKTLSCIKATSMLLKRRIFSELYNSILPLTKKVEESSDIIKKTMDNGFPWISMDFQDLVTENEIILIAEFIGVRPIVN